MGWKDIFSREPRHIRRTRAYLQEARMAMLEHRIAAEHYQASANMYAERARRLEQEIAEWEAQHRRSDTAVVQPPVPMPGKHPGPVRVEQDSPAISNAPPSVGIIRAA